jgi:hypothetical protein
LEMKASVQFDAILYALRERGKNYPDWETVTIFKDTLKEDEEKEIVKVVISKLPAQEPEGKEHEEDCGCPSCRPRQPKYC